MNLEYIKAKQKKFHKNLTKRSIFDFFKKIPFIQSLPNAIEDTENQIKEENRDKKIDYIITEVKQSKELIREELLEKDVRLSTNFDDFEKIFSSISKGLDKHPSWDLKVSVDGKVREYQIRPKNDKPFSFNLKLKYPTQNSIVERINEASKTRVSLKITKKEFIEAILSSEDLPKMNDSWKIEEIEIIPQPFPPPKPYKIEIKGTGFSIDYLLMELKYMDEEKMILTSTNSPIEFKFTGLKNKKTVGVNITFSSKEKSFKDELLIFDFVEAIRKSGKFFVKLLDSDFSMEGSIDDMSGISSFSSEWHEFLRNLDKISKTFKLTFERPEQITLEDSIVVNEVYRIITEGSLTKEFKDVSFKTSTEFIKNLIEQHRTNGSLKGMKLSAGKVSVELFGKTIGLGSAQRIFPDIKFDNLEELEINLKNNKSGTMKVKMLPVDDKNFIERYSNWLKS